MNLLQRLGQIILLFAATSCTVGPAYTPPQITLPKRWHEAPSPVDSDSCHLPSWDTFDDPLLTALIERAAKQNLDIQVATLRLKEARLIARGSEADNYPHIDASITGGHLYSGKKGILDAFLRKRCHCVKQNVNIVEVGFDASWEIDLFGYLKHEKSAADADSEASEEELTAVHLTLEAEIARNVVNLRALQQRKTLLEQVIILKEESSSLASDRITSGKEDAIAQLKIVQERQMAKAKLPLLDISIAETLHRLALLAGLFPGELDPLLTAPRPLPPLPSLGSLAIPSEVIRNRPDIRQSERQLAAASERVGSAVASLYPRLSLYGFVGEVGSQLKSLTNGQGATWFAAPQLLFPIFNSRLLQQDVKMNRLKAQEACIRYQKTVYAALEEVENSLVAQRYEKERYEALSLAKGASEEIVRLTTDLYEAGFVDFSRLLQAQEELLASEVSCLDSEEKLLLTTIALRKAIGAAKNERRW